jgi:hypothetical protein
MTAEETWRVEGVRAERRALKTYITKRLRELNEARAWHKKESGSVPTESHARHAEMLDLLHWLDARAKKTREMGRRG